VFWKVVEFLVRLIYFRRFRTAKQIGEAGRLLTDGRPEQALTQLERAGRRLHQTLLPLYAYTRGRILDALGRRREAEEAFRVVVLADPESGKADLELAVLCGKQRRFDECREWLDRLAAKPDEDSRQRAVGIRELVDAIESGEREAEFAARARDLAERAIGPDGERPGLPPDLELLDRWIAAAPQAAREQLDEIALLIGQSLVADGAKWRISLALEESVVERVDGTSLDPFATVAAAFDDGTPLSELITAAWQADPSSS